MTEQGLLGLFVGTVLTLSVIGVVILVKALLENWIEKIAEKRAEFVLKRHEIRENHPR